VIEQKVGKEIRSSTPMAQIVGIEEGLTEARILIRPDPPVEQLSRASGTESFGNSISSQPLAGWLQMFASRFEFSHRSWFIVGIFGVGQEPLYLGKLIGVFGAEPLSSRTGWAAQMILAIVFCYRL
jgi:hypothetical protein